MNLPLLSVEKLNVQFPIKTEKTLSLKKSYFTAVNDVSFDIADGEVLGLVGESGCGKSTIGRTLVQLQKAKSGNVLFENQNIIKMNSNTFQPLRKKIQIIFQDPFSSLNPRLTIYQTLKEPLKLQNKNIQKNEVRNNVVNTLKRVGLEEDAMYRYPHEFSGGQRQRIGIARAIILSPKLLIADEATSALDVSIQAQILNLIKKLQRESKMTMLFISHDLGVVRHISDRIAVMYNGEIVEIGKKEDIFNNPKHEYTQKLLNAIPPLPTQNGEL